MKLTIIHLSAINFASNCSTLQIPGRPRVTAPFWPPALGTKWYECNGEVELRSTSRLVGRTELLQEINDLIANEEAPAARVIALAGIGGIG